MTLSNQNPDQLGSIYDLTTKVYASKHDGKEKVSLGITPNYVAQSILAQTGLKVHGLNMEIDSQAVVHIIKEHGNNTEQQLRGQAGITPKDYTLIPDILKSPDSVIKGKVIRGGGDSLVYSKCIASRKYFLVMRIQGYPLNPHMTVKTLYIKTKC